MFKKPCALGAVIGLALFSLGWAQTASPRKPAVQRLRVLVLAGASLPELNDFTKRHQQLKRNWEACQRRPALKAVRLLQIDKLMPQAVSPKVLMLGGMSLSLLGLLLAALVFRKRAAQWRLRAGGAAAMLLMCLPAHDFSRAFLLAHEIDRLKQHDFQSANRYLAALASLNVPFDLFSLSERPLRPSDLAGPDTLRYNVVIVACSPDLLSRQAQEELGTICNGNAVALIAAHNGRPPDRSELATVLTKSFSGSVRPALGGLMALRMDDPGAPVKAYFDDYRHDGLAPAQWRQIAGILEKHQAAMSIFYVPAWVDDGDSTRGLLEYEGKAVTPRVPGKIYDAKSVVYTVRQNAVRMDQAAEFEILKNARHLFDIESHAHTHLEIDLAKWLQAPDKYSNKAWYRELYHLYDDRDLTAAETYGVLKQSTDKISAWFEKAPTTLVPPGHKISGNTFAVAGKMGLRLLTMNTVFLLDSTHYVEAGFVLNPDFGRWQEFDRGLLADGFPVVGYLHDRDLALQGSEWFARCLEGWREIGVRRFITFRELAGLLRAQITAHVQEHAVSGWVDISGTGGSGDDYSSRYFSAHGFPLLVTLPAGRRADRLIVNDLHDADFEIVSPREIVVKLPPFSNASRQKFALYLQ